MINLDVAKRVEKTSQGVKYWVFDCMKGCGNEIKVYKHTVSSASGLCKLCSAFRRRKKWSIDESRIIRIERVMTAQGFKNVKVLRCEDCENEVRVWPGQNRVATGKCKICANVDNYTTRKKPYEYLYNVLVGNAKSRNIPLELSLEEFCEFTSIQNCTYCDDIVKWSPHYSNKSLSTAYNLDRRDSNLGYTMNNCVVCCPLCNMTKGNRFSFEEFMLLSDGLKQIQSLRK
jgi:hypothetical protein